MLPESAVIKKTELSKRNTSFFAQCQQELDKNSEVFSNWWAYLPYRRCVLLDLQRCVAVVTWFEESQGFRYCKYLATRWCSGPWPCFTLKVLGVGEGGTVAQSSLTGFENSHFGGEATLAVPSPLVLAFQAIFGRLNHRQWMVAGKSSVI